MTKRRAEFEEQFDPVPVPIWFRQNGNVVPTEEAQLREWIVEGPRQIDMEKETLFIPEIQLVHLLACKNSLGGYKAQQIAHARRCCNPSERVGKSGFVNRAAVKMAAIDFIFDYLFSGAERSKLLLYFGDLAAAPGGFSEYLIWRRNQSGGSTAKGFGITLRSDLPFQLDNFNSDAPSELFHPSYGSAETQENGDLCDARNIHAFQQLVSRQTHGKMLHVVMADGGFAVDGQENIQEILNKQLLLAQCATALMTLRVGGHFMCKAFDLFTPFSASLLHILSSAFGAICIYKPPPSRPANSERYIVCREMRSGSRPLADFLLSVNERLQTMKGTWVCDVLQFVPLEQLKETGLFDYLQTSNIRIAKTQTRALERMVEFIDRRRECGFDQQAIRDACLQKWKIAPSKVAPRYETAQAYFLNVIQRNLIATLDFKKMGPLFGHSPSSCDGWVALIPDDEKDVDNFTYVLGTPGMAFAWVPKSESWCKMPDTRITANTLLFAKVVDSRTIWGIDAMMIAGEDLNNEPFDERYRRLAMLVDALASEETSCVRLHRLLKARECVGRNPLLVFSGESSFSCSTKFVL